MPDLDQLFDTLVADVTAGTRAAGAPKAIKQARQRRVRIAVAAVAAVAVIAVGGGLAAGTSRGSDQPSPAVDPATSSPTAKQESADPAPNSETPNSELNAILERAPGWAIDLKIRDDYDYAFNGPCSGDWGKDAIAGGDGGVAGRIGERSYVGYGYLGFSSNSRASDAAARFVQSLKSCSATAWRVQPIAQTGALLASSPHAVAWIQQGYSEVHVMQAPTTNGPPPLGIQVEVAEWLVDYIAEQNTD